jgi:arginine transport system permease protein
MLQGYYLNILLASKTTLGVAFSALLVGLLLALVLALAEFGPKWLAAPIKGWGILIRGLPEIFVLFVCYYGITQLLTHLMKHYVDVSAFQSGVIALSLIFSAYATQVFIAAFSAIPKEELLAGKALGMSSTTIIFSIVLPQLFRHALPGLLNLWLVLLKDSSIVSLIGLHDIMNTAHLAASETFQPFNYYVFAGVIYLILTYLSTSLGGKIEKHFAL